MANPDNRADNVERLQEAIHNTMDNLHEAEDFLAAHADEMHSRDVQNLVAKNDRRRRAIEGFREEIRDEAHDARKRLH
ncbi:small acid-soluble spore protein Tlp [Alicyclobacillus vulcanalis]|uniref:Small acid-soluble spore protein (Thioredoxin-like protein) n=1 Tax=Alicyclobacillus vulcanalis TaxID=252246 RepID=A0A1N7JZX5_9BACL|nr:small acid-soluble spore protein Tlp [Alicyclobacillus vulcanalis]SIS54806.1 small acid-soluble spore protein (thioredoxin-like protein) [Alicyclobacillus vulcanalis]